MTDATHTENASTVVSTVLSATDIKTYNYDLDVIIRIIRSGGKNLRTQIEAIRKMFRSELDKHGDIKLAKGAIDPAKKQLPGVTWSGTFTERAGDKLIKHSGLLCADLDNLGMRLKDVREKLLASPHVWAVFLSPSGDGLKAVFRVPADGSRHLGSFRAVEQYIKDAAGVEVDQSCKDMARLCFLSYDPEVFYNPGAVEIEPLPEPEKPQYHGANVDLSARQKIANEILGPVSWGSEAAGFTTCPGKHLHTTGDGDRDCKIDLDQVPTVHCFHNSCRGILDGVNHEIRSRIGKIENEKSNSNQKGSQNSYNSENSYAREDSPKPLLGSEALYGLAGDIVRAIEPHSESDPVGILSNLLTGFGNAVGPTPYARVEETEHHLNINIVQVGETSKGRKGTAWSTPRKMFREIDSDWADSRITGGLSSGEGVIYAVRDPRYQTKPIRADGKVTGYEEVLVDKGEDDKRLLLIEEEFSQALKVMSREGNILSPIIRQAWDHGNLRSLTKNDPNRATGAHISIIAHITRGELLRHLVETEQTNGFANRFIWLLVTRSKEIPRPKGVPFETLSPLTDRLRDAATFARRVGEIDRDDEANREWDAVYHDLSDVKPGLTGALIARGEAQVFRLSCLYALLDQSAVIRKEHQRAALALWEYSEKSVKAIFGDLTGDPNVDAAKEALKAKGELTLTELHELFGRNVTSAEIDRVIAVLVKTGFATVETTTDIRGRKSVTVLRWATNSTNSTKSTEQNS